MRRSPLFFDLDCQCVSSLALIEGATQLNFAQLAEEVARVSQQLISIGCPERLFVFLKAHNSLATLVVYLACLQTKHPMMLLDPAITEDKLQNLIEQYHPNRLIDGINIEFLHDEALPLAPHLALLLSTSGTTGSAKQVCLSYDNLQANAQAITDYLPILSSDRTITTLPFFYSYGLSVINSHLLCGACIVLNEDSIVSRDFWQLFKQHNISSFAGVPYSYDMLLKLRFERMDLPSLRYFTQAGGRLAQESVSKLAQYAQDNDKSFFIMYGQTEATARMAYLSPERVIQKTDSIGRAIPGGNLFLRNKRDEVISGVEESGELTYQGPNIMLGYATDAKDLVSFEPITELATGDLAYRDKEGDFFITGRLKRFVKLFGLRLNLDEVETIMHRKDLKCYCIGDDSKLTIALLDEVDQKQLKEQLSRELHLNQSVINIIIVNELPITPNGKRDYPALKKIIEREYAN
jgi:acyl-coenzyme A synthetase/AMP-(fatty) acid ligase